ncbi:hypothetical protein B0E43_02100 [Algoriphagus sp. A40]|nr:hypothetical protein B0E43_02100 [Algoriphagus sp. A40]
MGLGYAANAQITSSAPASATVLFELTIELDGTQNEIAFGNISSTTPGAVELDANGTSNVNTGSTTNVARFDLGGADSEVTVNYDPTVILIDGAANEIIMTPEVVGAETVAEQTTATLVPSGTTVTLAAGAYSLWVGGSFPALAGQVAGAYTGTFNIAVEYN